VHPIYRESLREEKPDHPGEINCYVVAQINFPENLLFLRARRIFIGGFGISIITTGMLYNFILTFDENIEFLLNRRLEYDKKFKEHDSGQCGQVPLARASI
jgi:hypothetical protein